MWHPLFTGFAEQWRALLVRAAHSLRLPDPEDVASDVIQTFLNRWSKEPTVQRRQFLDDVCDNCRTDRLHACFWQELCKASRKPRNRRLKPEGDLGELNPLVARDDPTADCEAEDLQQVLLDGATEDERVLANRLVLGQEMREIAQELCRSKRTVYSWRERLMRRAIGLGILKGHADD